jgi:hypothetical protein
MTPSTWLLQRARRGKEQLKLWDAELDRLRYPAYYRGRLSPEEANLLLYNRLRQGQPLLAGKLGSVESRLLGEFRYGQLGLGRFSRRTRQQAHQNAGVFPVDDASLEAAVLELWSALQQLELLGCWPVEYQARLLMDLPQLPLRCEMPDLEPFRHLLPWTAALEGLRVLVLHPFSRSFAHFGPRACAKAASDIGAKLDAPFRGRRTQCLRIGVSDNEIDAFHLRANHIGNRVTAGTANTNHCNFRLQFVNHGWSDIDAHNFIPLASLACSKFAFFWHKSVRGTSENYPFCTGFCQAMTANIAASRFNAILTP